ncbi:hypothetical protein DDE20_15000 [Pararhodobacter oceanensis]|uniref:Uncharacterized protein n=2 Tax=Pararhodobacter oceanensis TaxID=2172121 RepID=A0A2T8HQU5_9RHOB|nr:hypothetical protein DDE20_15000 [Pararhodobacter oceanensis]
MTPTAVNSRCGKHVFHRFRREDVDAFLAEFTNETLIADALGIGKRELKSQMKAAGAKPYLLAGEVGVRIFRRSELPSKFQV